MAAYERTVTDKQVSVPDRHAAQRACLVHEQSGSVVCYASVRTDGTIPVNRADGLELVVLIPEDDADDREVSG